VSGIYYEIWYSSPPGDNSEGHQKVKGLEGIQEGEVIIAKLAVRKE
jgi:hypothetical protein